MDSNEILRQFEDDLVAGKNPTPAEYEAKYGPIDPETKSLMEVMMGLVLLGEEAQLPERFEERQRKLARELIAKKKAEEMVAHWQAGEEAFHREDFAQSREHYERLLTAVKYLKDERWVAFVSSRLGNIAEAMEEHDRAIEYHQQAAKLYRKLGMKRELLICRHNLGNLYLIVKKNYPDARQAYQEAIELGEELGLTFTLPHEYLNLGVVEKNLNNNERAEKYYRAAHDLFQQADNRQGLAYAECNLGELSDYLGRSAEAIRWFESALGRLKEIKEYQLAAQTAGVLGSLYVAEHQPDRAREYYQEALELLDKESTITAPPKKPEFILPEIPADAQRDPARFLRFLLDREAENVLQPKN